MLPNERLRFSFCTLISFSFDHPTATTRKGRWRTTAPPRIMSLAPQGLVLVLVIGDQHIRVARQLIDVVLRHRPRWARLHRRSDIDAGEVAGEGICHLPHRVALLQ